MALHWHYICFGLLLLVLLFGHQSALAMEFMEEEDERDDTVMEAEQMDSAEMPKLLTTYTRDTIAHFNPHKSDAGFRQLWERIPLQKSKDVIKR